MINISIQSHYNKYNYYKTISCQPKNTQFKSKSPNMVLPSETYRAYALSKPSFKGVNQINDISLILTEEKTNPRICVEILNNNKFDSKIGVPAVYEIAVHDQLYDEKRRNPKLKDEESQVTDYKRRFDVSCQEEDLVETLKLIRDKFVNINIEKRYIDKAMKLAPIGFKLHTLNLESVGNYEDIPKGTSEEDYNKIISEISYNDIQDFNDSILNNSDTRITLSVNKEFYNKHKDEIKPLIAAIYEH